MLEVVAGRHHGHGNIRPCLTDSANQLAAHLFNAGKDVLDPGTNFGNALVPLFLPCRKEMVARPFALDAGCGTPLLSTALPAQHSGSPYRHRPPGRCWPDPARR